LLDKGRGQPSKPRYRQPGAFRDPRALWSCGRCSTGWNIASAAHVPLCRLALLLVRIAERQAGQTWRRINLELGPLYLVTLAGPAGRLERTTTLTAAQRELFAATGIAPPPHSFVTAAWADGEQ
jgi:hypothetical protein